MAKQRVNILSPSAINALRRDHEQLRMQVQVLEQRVRASSRMENAVLEIGKTDADGISASTIPSGGTPGTGTITPYRIRADGTLAAVSQDETCRNIAGAVAGDTYIAFLRDAWGEPWVIVEFC